MTFIDLTHSLDGSTPVYPGDPAVSLAPVKTIGRDGYAAFELRAGMHAGTHVDAPMHLTENQKTIGSYGADSFCGKCAVLDARGKEIIDLTPEYAEATAENGIVLLYTGFDAFWADRELYFGYHPVISPELADFLAARKIKMLGMDTPSPDRAPFALHKKLLESGIFILENLTNLGAVWEAATEAAQEAALETAVETALEASLKPKEIEIFAFPLKIAAEASLVRAVARI